jgi:3-isopropylmalate dehydratase large subunit 1
MERTFVEKILNAKKGSIVVREPDYVMSHDNSARVRFLFERIRGTRVHKPSQVVIVLDGKVSGLVHELSFEYNSIRDFVEEQGIEHFYDCDSGISHQILSELVRPGMLVVGSDSHTATAGAFNTFALGINKTETAVLWKTGQMWFRVPGTIKVVLKNRLPEGVQAKDLALWIKGVLGELDVNGQAIEYHGEGVESLTIDDRMTIANMSTEMGVVSAAFPPDDRLADYFNEPAVRGVWADEDAVYERFIEIDLARVFPLVFDTRKGEIRSVDEMEGLKIQQGLIGACASGRLEDLRLVSMILDGKRIADGFQLFVVPASRDIYLKAVEEGIIDKIAQSGAMVLGSSCGPCLGVGHVASAGNSRLISTANSRYIGGSSHAGVEKYIASPATIAMTALRGELTTVIHFDGAHYKYEVKPVEPVILEEYDYRKVNGVWNYSDIDNISSNQIFAEKLMYRLTLEQVEEIKPYLFAGLDKNFATDVKPGDIIIAGENFGCGQLVKHAATGLVAVGVKLIIAKSVNHDFYRMAINHGLQILVDWAIADAYTSGEQLTFDWKNGVAYLNDREYPLPRVDKEFSEIIEKGGLVKTFS